MGKLILLMALLVGFPMLAFASLSAPNSSIQWSSDGRRILVMVSYDPPYDRNGVILFPDGRVIDIHQTFSASGVYDAKTFAPVWQVNWFAHQREIVASPDLRYVARLNRFALTQSKRWKSS